MSKEFIFDNEPYSFYGFIGTSVSRINSLSIIRYDKDCLDAQKLRQGSEFSWSASTSDVGSS